MGYSEKGKQGFQSTHCLSSHPLYKTWKSIKNRCYNPNSKDYKDYGNRGISMYEEWENDFVEFLYWALKNLREVEIIKPVSLRNEIREILKKANDKYDI